MAPSTDNCFGSFIELYESAADQGSKFSGIGSWVAALVQNLLSNVNSITQIQEKMQAATQSNDTIALQFWRGRLANIVIVFDPIPTDDYQVTPTSLWNKKEEIKLE